MSHWAVVTIQPNSSNLVSKRLSEIGIEHFFIKRRIVRIWHGKKIERFVNAFFNYIFVQWQHLNAAFDVAGITDFLRSGEGPAQLSQEVIDALRSRCVNDVLPMPERPGFNFGQAVRIRGDGLFSGREAIFQFKLREERVCVLVDMLGRMVPIELSEQDVVSRSEYRRIVRRARRNRKRRSYRRRRRYDAACEIRA